ncbi:MAG: hypothetical protein K2V38_21930, partial [Gemmataceae bacterium]|nr:hypothetical protein [Gemmataceae bacterium]
MGQLASEVPPPTGVALTLLQRLAAAAGVEIDPTRAAQAVREDEREIPPTQSRAARLRLAQAAGVVG